MICSLTCLGAGAGLRTRLEVILEPTGAARFPVARFLSARGHAVYRVSSAKAAELRQFYRRHAKSNGIDAEALARLPLAAPDGPIELELAAAVLDRRVRACDRLTQQTARRKTRIKDLVRQLMPMLERYADPGALLAAGPAQLTALISGASRGHQGQVRASPGRPARPEEKHRPPPWQEAGNQPSLGGHHRPRMIVGEGE
jgi:transposase